MKIRISPFVLLLLLITLVGCQRDSTNQSPEQTPQAPTTSISGTVIETMNALGYTYVLVETNTDQVWAATPQFAVKVGDLVVVPDGMAMHNHYSQTLDRHFDKVYFVESILNASVASAPADNTLPTGMPPGHPPISGMGKAAGATAIDVVKLEGGMSIEEIYAARSTLSGQKISLRGQVVKFSPQIMGTNWIHLQDGSGNPETGTHNLVLTSGSRHQVGDIVVVSGKLTIDKDFGHGYVYDLLMENAAISAE